MTERRAFWPVVLTILAVGLERLAWLSLRTIVPDGGPIDHFAAAHDAAFQVATGLLVVAVPLLLLAVALYLGSSLRIALVAGLFATVPELLIVITLQSGRFRDGFRFLWYRLMDLETAAHYPADVIRSAFEGRLDLTPPLHWLAQAGSTQWRPIDLYIAIGGSALFWFVLFSMIARQPKHRRRLRGLQRKAVREARRDAKRSAPAAPQGD